MNVTFHNATSAVCVFAIENPFDLDVLVILAKEHPMILRSESEQRWTDVFQLFGRSLAQQHKTAKGLENL